MATAPSAKQSAAIIALVNSFESRSIKKLVDCAGAVFSHRSGNSHANMDVARFNTKMTSRDPRFATFFIRTVDSLRSSPTIHNVDALIELLIKCRMAHVFYKNSGRERSEFRGGTPKSPYFSRRSVSRSKLQKDIVRSELNSHVPSTSVDSLPTIPVYGAGTISTTPSTTAKNPLFGAFASPCSIRDTSINTNSEHVGVVCVDRSKYSRAPLQSRIGTCASVPEKPLCMELCGALVGLEGSYFRSDNHGYMRLLDSCSLSQSQKVVVESILSLAHLFTDIVRMHSQYFDDLVVQALSTSSQAITEEFMHDVGEISVNCRPMSLLRVASAVEVWRDRLIELYRLHALKCECGTSLLERLYTTYSSVRYNFVVDHAMKNCSGILYRSVLRLMSGCCLEEDASEVLQHRSLQIPSYIPAWIASYIAKIDKSWISMDFVKNVECLDKARNVINTQLDPKSFYILSERYKLERIVTDVCRIVCGNLVQCFVVEHHIIDHFVAARCFLLIHDPCFSLALYQKFCECTYGLRSKLSQRDANNALIAAAALCPSIKRFPFRVKLDALSSANDSPNTSSRLQFVQPLHPFYIPDEPVLQIFKDNNARYDSLFHFIWPVDLCLLMVSDNAVSVGQKCLRQRNSSESSMLNLISTLLSNAERVLLQIRIYIIEMVDQWFQRLHCWIDEAIDFDALVDAHNKYLDGLIASFFLTRETEEVYGLIMSILQFSHDLSVKCSKFLMDIESGENIEGSANYAFTQMAIIRAKLQKLLPTFIAHIQDLSKQQNSTAYALLLGVMD